MMSPGTYLAKRRHASGLSIDDVAAIVRTAPRLGEIDRRAWIERIESDVAAISPDVQTALRHVFDFSSTILFRLIDLRSYGDAAIDLPRMCAHCACSELDACLDPATNENCGWAGPDICTACASVQAEEISHAA